MNAVPFDTLSMARRLQASDLEATVAAGMVEALVEGLTGGGLATTADIARSTAAIDHLRIDLKTDVAALHTQLKTDNELLRGEIMIKFGSMMVIGVGCHTDGDALFAAAFVVLTAAEPGLSYNDVSTTMCWTFSR